MATCTAIGSTAAAAARRRFRRRLPTLLPRTFHATAHCGKPSLQHTAAVFNAGVMNFLRSMSPHKEKEQEQEQQQQQQPEDPQLFSQRFPTMQRKLDQRLPDSSTFKIPYDVDRIVKDTVNTANVHEVYEVVEEVGHGAFGSVHKAVHWETGDVVAIKSQFIEDNPWCFRELEMACRVKHPNCTYATDAFLHKDMLLIVTPFCSGSDLYDYMVDGKRVNGLGEKRAFQLTLEMLLALEACHRAGFAHLDVKPENFMFESPKDGSPLILVDYGSAEPFRKAAYAETADEYRPDRDDELGTLARITGTACYMSPEVASGSFSSRSDVWSAGVVAYILVALEPPFELVHNSSSSVDATPRFDNANFEHPKILGMSQAGQDLLRNLMHNDPALRCSATEAISYITKHLETLQ